MRNDDPTVRTYDAIGDAYARGFPQPSEHLDTFLRYVPKSGRVLDVGCGPGIDSRYMTGLGFRVRAIDASAKMVVLAERNAPKASVELGDILEITEGWESLDGVLASFSLIHLRKRDVPPILASFWRWLKPKGVLYLGLQQGASLEGLVVEPLDHRRKLFLNVYEAVEVDKLVDQAGFSVRFSSIRPSRSVEEFSYRKRIVIATKHSGESD